MSLTTRDPGERTLREAEERRRQMRGLLVLAVMAIVFVLVRFGLDRVFTPGWWRLW